MSHCNCRELASIGNKTLTNWFMSVLTGQLDPMSPDVRIRNVERKCRERPTDKCIEEKLKMIVKGEDCFENC